MNVKKITLVATSVADPDPGSGIGAFLTPWIRDPESGIGLFRIPDPGSRISDPKTGRKERGEKRSFVKHFFVATNFPKCKIIFF